MNLKQRIYRLFCALIVCLAAVFGLNQAAYADILTVDGSVMACPGDGISWGTAYKYLQDALDFASDPDNNIDQIWIAAGTYIPDEDCATPGGTGLWSASFSMIDDVAIYGGFDGTEIDRDERDPVANVTILSGELGPGPPGCGVGSCYEAHETPGCENLACCEAVCEVDPDCCTMEWDFICVIWADARCPTNDNAFSVVDAVGVGPTSLLDGFTITRGISTDLRGGGLQIVDASPTVVRCIFIDNQAGNGGGVHVKADGPTPSDPLFVNCSFIQNVAGCWGGGMAVEENASVTVVNSVFRENNNSAFPPTRVPVFLLETTTALRPSSTVSLSGMYRAPTIRVSAVEFTSLWDQ